MENKFRGADFDLDLTKLKQDSPGPFTPVKWDSVAGLEGHDGDLVLLEATPAGQGSALVRWWFYLTSGRQIPVPAWLWDLKDHDDKKYGMWHCRIVGLVPVHPGKR